jgi:hypothetical protein
MLRPLRNLSLISVEDIPMVGIVTFTLSISAIFSSENTLIPLSPHSRDGDSEIPFAEIGERLTTIK